MRGLAYKTLVDDTHRKPRWTATVEGIILPVLDPDDINFFFSLIELVVFPLKTRGPPKRPPKKRRLSTGEYQVSLNFYFMVVHYLCS